MVKRKIKQLLMEKEQELIMNLSNNYKDLARDALEEYRRCVSQCYEQGDLKEKDYMKYKHKVDEYTVRMKDYHH